MIFNRLFLPLAALVLAIAVVRAPAAATHYVYAGGTNPVAPYTSWATAATNLQDAANSAAGGDSILVTNGVYQYGGNVATARLTLVPPITVQSVNGAAVTTIDGGGVMRCVMMSSGDSLTGFTLANGAAGTHSGGGVSGLGGNFFAANCVFSNNSALTGGGGQSGTYSNCTFIANVATNYGGGTYGATNYQCSFVSNSAGFYGGGVFQGTLTNCLLTGNAAAAAGGVYQAALNNCTLTGNRATSASGSGGGGALSSALTNCLISGNSSGVKGGGVSGGTLVNCLVVSNSAPGVSGGGSGMYFGTAYNCLFTGNTNGSAASGSTLYNCTLAGNFSLYQAANGCTLNNSIIYYNSNGAAADCYQCKLTNCCTTLGNGNFSLPNNSISNAPAFVDPANGNYHLQIGSPGMDAGTNVFAAGTTDLDGNPRIVNGTVDMGAYEIQNTNPVHYVCIINGTPLSPYTNWLTAATNIQDAVAVAVAGDFVVVSNGIYKGGGGIMFGSESNRVVLTNAITLLGLYGASSTVIVGSINANSMRCVYVGSNSVLNGFTLVNGATASTGDTIKERSGGGAWCETGGVISNCFFGGDNFPYANGNSTLNYCTANYAGAGVYGGTVYNSTFANNTATLDGGAAAATVLVNCLIETNQASVGGGIYSGTASNCTFFGNICAGGFGAGGGNQSTLYNCTLIRNSGPAGGTYNCTNYNCTLVNNGGNLGGGAYGGVLYNCLVLSNTAASGGGAYESTLYNCNVVSNRTTGLGGGVRGCTLYSCTVSTNIAPPNDGGGGYFCVFHNCTLSGNNGSGAVSSTLYGCWLTGNTNSTGGGAFNSSLFNCVLTGNSASGSGGGANGGFLGNCTVVSNSAALTGGVYNSTLYNSIIYYNASSSPTSGATNYAGSKLVNCDTTPLATDTGNITNDPALVNFAAGDFHLQTNSPCINSGNNAYETNTTDFDGNPRIAGGTVDIGAYEFQTPSSVISYAWLQQYGLPTDGSADYADTDGDGMNNWQEWRTGTVPTDATSVLQMSSVSNSVPGVVVSWQSVANVMYLLQRSADLSVQPPFSVIHSNVFGKAGVTTYTDTTATNGNSYFYRVGVQ